MTDCVAAIDQGTTSTRCILFDASANVLGTGQREHRQIYPRPGWVEHDATEIWAATGDVVRDACAAAADADPRIAAVGITNQRETVVFWNRRTGAPYGNAIVWQDTRTDALCATLAAGAGPDRFRAATGLPLATYFSGPKIRWALDHVDGLQSAVARGDALCGTIDTWLVWHLTGGRHVTDVTNASRTMLMNLRTLDWDDDLLAAFDIPKAMLPEILPSSDAEAWGTTLPDGPFAAALPIGGAVGDQQAALIGQACFAPGDTKSTYGTGCFLLLNTGPAPKPSASGLLTTVAYALGDAPAVYALEGSVAIAGALVQWLRDNLGLIDSADEVEALARSVDDSGGVFIVPAFSGLFAPRWRADARGVIVGLTRFVTKAHLARAALEATAHQTREVLDAMRADADVGGTSLRVDGGMVFNDLLMQFQADVLDLPVVRPRVTETTALGAAYVAGRARDVYGPPAAFAGTWREDRRWMPTMDADRRAALARDWDRAVERSLGWVEP